MSTLKTLRSLIVVAAAFTVPALEAQAGGGPLSVQEGIVRAQAECGKAQAAIIQSRALMVNARGEALKRHAEARKIGQECRSMELDNEVKAAETFYGKRQMWHAYRAQQASARPTQQDLVRYARAAAPRGSAGTCVDPLSGRIEWPDLLQQEPFDAYRLRMDILFAARTPGNSSVGSDFYRQVYQLSEQARVELKGIIGEISPAEYLAVKKFIDALAHEAQLPQALGHVAAAN